MKKGRGLRAMPGKPNCLGVSKVKLSNLLSKLKQDIINDVATHLDNMQARRKKEETDVMLAIYCPHCREGKRNNKYKIIASLEPQSMPTEFKAIDENGELLYVSQ